MRKRLVFIILFAGFFYISYAESLIDTIAAGNKYYAEGEYEKAIEKYKSVLDSGYHSSELYFNLGNAYYKTHNITMALVNYERARIISPRDEEIAHNLEMVRTLVVDQIDVLGEFFLRKWYRGMISIFRSDSWAIISIFAFILALVLFLAYLFSKRITVRKISFWLAVILISGSLFTFLFSYNKYKIDKSHNAAIILSPSVTVKSSPDESGTDLFQLHEGTKVMIDDQLGDWREIRLSDGNRGWIRLQDIVII